MAEIKYLWAFERLTCPLEVGADNVGEGIMAEHPEGFCFAPLESCPARSSSWMSRVTEQGVVERVREPEIFPLRGVMLRLFLKINRAILVSRIHPGHVCPRFPI